jgi:hypothetical protein
MALNDARFGDAHDELPARCWLAPPVLAPGQWLRFPQSQYEGLVSDLMARGVPVPGHPASCGTPGCGHAQVRHRHRTRTKACQVSGCTCLNFVHLDQDQFAWAVPQRAGRAYTD